MKKIKVALLIDEFFGGAGTAYGGYGFLARKYIAKYIPCDEIELDVLIEMNPSYNDIISEKVDDVILYKFPNNKKKVKKWLKEKNYDVFLSIELTCPSYEILKLIDKQKLVLWIQDPRPKSAWENVIDTMTSIKDRPFYCQESNDYVNFLSNLGGVKYISQGNTLNPLAFELYNLPSNTKVQYLPNPIQIDYDYNFDISKKKNKIVFLGRLEAQKRAWLFCEVAKRMPEYDFYVMGKFFRYEEENRKMLEPYMNGDIKNLHFMGHMDGEEKEALLKEAKILLNTSIWEGIPISWLECLQYGTLIVSCLERENLVGKFGNFVGEILGDGYDQVDKFVPAIKELLENDDLYQQKAKAAVEYIREFHNIERFQKDLRAVLLKESSIDYVYVLRKFINKVLSLFWRKQYKNNKIIYRLFGIKVKEKPYAN